MEHCTGWAQEALSRSRRPGQCHITGGEPKAERVSGVPKSQVREIQSWDWELDCLLHAHVVFILDPALP